MSKYKRPIRIVVAEDDEDDKQFISDAFNQLKILNNVKFVENGEELIDTLRNNKKLPDLIFLDLNMPVMNGFQSIKIIRKDNNLKKIPIIVLTTSKNEQDILKTYEDGINAYIVKPFTFQDLMKVIQETTNYYFEIVTLPFENME
jgi:CheY-like chemotaxis protein